MTRGKLVLSARSAHLAARIWNTGHDERKQDLSSWHHDPSLRASSSSSWASATLRHGSDLHTPSRMPF